MKKLTVLELEIARRIQQGADPRDGLNNSDAHRVPQAIERLRRKGVVDYSTSTEKYFLTIDGITALNAIPDRAV